MSAGQCPGPGGKETATFTTSSQHTIPIRNAADNENLSRHGPDFLRRRNASARRAARNPAACAYGQSQPNVPAVSSA